MEEHRLPENHSHNRAVKRYVAPAAALLAVLLGVIIVAVATPALAQTPDSRDPLTLYDTNKNDRIDGEEFVTAFRDYAERRIDGALLMWVRELYLSTRSARTPPAFWHEMDCTDYDNNPSDDVISQAEAIVAVQRFFAGEIPLSDSLLVLECYYATSAHVVRFVEAAYSVDEQSNQAITVEMSRTSSSTIDIPIEIAGGDAEPGELRFVADTSDTSTTTTTTFAIDATTTEFTVYTSADMEQTDATVILGFGTLPMDVFPRRAASSTTVTILDAVEVNISGPPDGVDEGASIEFTVRASRPPSSDLPVTVTVSEVGEFIQGEPQERVTIDAGESSASLTVMTDDDNSDDGDDGSITAAIMDNDVANRYVLGRASSVTVSVRDNDGTTQPSNRPPTFDDGDGTTTRSVSENTPPDQDIGSAVSASDPDDDRLTYSLRGTDRYSFNIEGSSGQLKTNAALDYETRDEYSVTVRVSDGRGGSDSIDVTIRVTNVDEHPVLVRPHISPQYLTEDGASTTLELSGKFRDPEGRSLSYSASSANSDIVSVSVNGSTLTMEPKASGTTTVTVTATDTGNLSVSQTFEVATFPKLEPPEVSVDSVGVTVIADFVLPDLSFYYVLSLTHDECPGSGSCDQPVPTPVVSKYPAMRIGTLEFFRSDRPPTEKTSYRVSLKACTNTRYDHCGEYAHSEEYVYKMGKPTSLDIVPIGTRLALLSWRAPEQAGPVASDSLVYKVETRDLPNGTWHSDERTGTTSLILLESILEGEGLADASAYQFQITTVGSSTVNYLASDPSDRVRATESPILSINGDSNLPDGHQGPLVGRAEVEWTRVDAARMCSIRWRILGGDHSKLGWEMNTRTLPTSFDDDDKEEISDPQQSAATIQPLHRNRLYAMQFNYAIQDGRGQYETVFSARDRYVYPATESVARNRLATIPTAIPQPNNTYEYVLCDDTFPEDGLERWRNFIDHAFSQWELETDNLVALDHIERHGSEPECADYSGFVNAIRNMVVMYLHDRSSPVATTTEIKAHTSYLLDMYDQSGIESTKNEDRMLNEVYVIRDEDTDDILTSSGVFPEVSGQVGHGWCEDPCAYYGHLEDFGTVDIKFRASTFLDADLMVPGDDLVPSREDVTFNSCSGLSEENNNLYGILVHEAGHALGLGYLGEYPGSDDKLQRYGHASIPLMSVMSAQSSEDYSCSPHPLDIMAIYALYQTTSKDQ